MSESRHNIESPSATSTPTAGSTPEARPSTTVLSPAHERVASHTTPAPKLIEPRIEIENIHLRVADTDRDRVHQLAQDVGAGLLARIGELVHLHGREVAVDHLQIAAPRLQSNLAGSSSESIVDEIIQALRRRK